MRSMQSLRWLGIGLSVLAGSIAEMPVTIAQEVPQAARLARAAGSSSSSGYVVPTLTPTGNGSELSQGNPIVRSVDVVGSQVLPEELIRKTFQPLYSQPFDLKALQAGVKVLNQWYQDQGYVLARVTDSQVQQDGQVILGVEEGKIEAIELQYINKDGTTDEDGKPIRGKTREFVVRRELQTQPGDIFQRDRIEQDLRRVYGLGLFEDVGLTLKPTSTPGSVVMVVNLDESKSLSLAPSAGFSVSNGFFGAINVQENNLGGNNQKLGAQVQAGQEGILYDIRFSDPWIAGDDQRTAYDVTAFNRRGTSLVFDGGTTDVTLANGDEPRVDRLGGGVIFARPLKDGWTVSLGTQYQQVSIRDGDGEMSPEDELGNPLSFSETGRDDLLLLEVAAVNDRRDSASQPTRGSVLKVGMEQTVPIGSGEIAMNRVQGNYSYYLPVKLTELTKGTESLAFNVQGGTVLGDLPPYEAFALGGANSVRGYGSGDLASSRSYVQASAEYRFPLFAIVGGTLFFDAATDLGSSSSVLGDPGGVRDKPGSGFGYGAGVRLKTPVGAVRVDYGINNQGDSQVQFGLGERF